MLCESCKTWWSSLDDYFWHLFTCKTLSANSQKPNEIKGETNGNTGSNGAGDGLL
jgi:hypothetical protein